MSVNLNELGFLQTKNYAEHEQAALLNSVSVVVSLFGRYSTEALRP